MPEISHIRIVKQTAPVVGSIIVVLFGLTVFRLTYFMPRSISCQQSVLWPGETPHGAIWERETVHFAHVPEGYTTLVGWINAATAVPCSDESAVSPQIEIRTLRIIARTADGNDRTIAEIDPRERDNFVGRLFPRVPQWFGETEGSDEGTISSSRGDGLLLDLGQVPLRIYHGWTEPRLPIDRTHTYGVEVEARITASARLQFGIDYWRDATSDYNGWDGKCVQSTNCEGWVSDWFGDTGGTFQTFRAPVPGPASVATRAFD